MEGLRLSLRARRPMGKEVNTMRWKARIFTLLLALATLATLILAGGAGGKWD